MLKKHFLATLTVILTGISLVIFLLLVPANLNLLLEFAKNHPYLAPLIVILWRILAIIIPPLPGGIVSFALLPVFGWEISFIYAVISVLIGTTIAFALARKFREPLVKRFVPLQELHHWEEKLTDKTEFFAFLIIRVTTGPVMDFISYIAGLSKISYKKFILATFIAMLPDAFLYWAGEEIYQTIYTENAYWGFAVVALVIIAVYLIYKSKFFKKA